MTLIEHVPARVSRPVGPAIFRGMCLRCPQCGDGRLFGRYLKVVDRCSSCGEELFHHRADDAPPYVTMMIVGHLVVGLMLWAEMSYEPPLWLHLALWLPLTIALTLMLLPVVKGGIVGLQWATLMHGFGGEDSDRTRGEGLGPDELAALEELGGDGRAGPGHP